MNEMKNVDGTMNFAVDGHCILRFIHILHAKFMPAMKENIMSQSVGWLWRHGRQKTKP